MLWDPGHLTDSSPCKHISKQPSYPLTACCATRQPPGAGFGSSLSPGHPKEYPLCNIVLNRHPEHSATVGMFSLPRIAFDNSQNVQSRPWHTFFYQLLDNKPALAPWFILLSYVPVHWLEAFRCLPSEETFQLNFKNANANVPVVSSIAQWLSPQ